MWKGPPKLETTAGKLREAVRVFGAVLISPLFIIWALVTGKSRHLSTGFAYLFSPLAMVWVLVTRRELHIHVGSVKYQIEPSHGPGPIRVGALFYSWRKDMPRPRLPEWRLGPVEVSLRDGFVIWNERLISRGNVTVKLFARGDERSYHRSPRPGDLSSVPIGPVEIHIRRYGPARMGDEAAEPRPKLPDFGEVVSMARMPVYGPVGAPLGLTATLYAATHQGPGANESHGVTLQFENHPRADEDPTRTAEHVYAYQMKQREEEMRRLVETYKLPTRWLVPYANPGARRDLAPLPTKVLHLHSLDNYFERSFEDGAPEEMRDTFLETSFEHDEAAPTLFAELPKQVRSRLTDRQRKQLCMQVGHMAWTYVPDILQEIAASGAQTIARRFVIDGKEFEGQLLYWPHQYPLCSFRLEHEENPQAAYRLEGAAYGITLEQLEELLEGLVAVNDGHKLIAQYQAGHDEYKRALEEQMRTRFQ